MRLAAAITTAGTIVPIMAQHSPYMTYETNAEASCNILRKRLSAKIDGVLTAKCISAHTPGSGVIEGKYLLIALN